MKKASKWDSVEFRQPHKKKLRMTRAIGLFLVIGNNLKFEKQEKTDGVYGVGFALAGNWKKN